MSRRKDATGASRRAAAREEFDYKHHEYLARYMSPQAQILPRKRTNFSTQRQRKLQRSVKHARHLGLLPFVG